MRLLLVACLLLSGSVARAADPDYDAQVAIALAAARAFQQQPAPAPKPKVDPSPAPARERLQLADGRWIVKQSDGTWLYEGVSGVAPKLNFPATAGGCGCTASRNCGASFCKSRGGTGCPTSCPVK